MNIKEITNDYKKISNKKVTFNAFVKFNRTSKALGFLIVNDGTVFDTIQIVYKKDTVKNFEELLSISNGSSVKVEGTLVLTPNSKQDFEVVATSIEILALADEDYPLQNKEHSFEYLREIAHLRPRSNYFYAVFKVRSLIAHYVNEYFYQEGFLWTHSPILTSNDAEGAGESFTVTTREDNKYDKDFFNKKASLTVSGQLNAEAFAMAFQKVYSFGPTFRAENSNTTKHAAEFWMIEPEIAFGTKEDLMKNGEELVKYVSKKLLDNCSKELEFLSEKNKIDLIERLTTTIKSKFEKITYTKAIQILEEALKNKKVSFEDSNIKWGMDLGTEHEKYLAEKHFKSPVYVYDYPAEIKSFYMLLNEDNKTVSGFDLLVPGIGELIGGSSREVDYDKLMKKVEGNKELIEELKWYLDLRRFGMSASAGYGLGFERLVMYLTGVENIRDVLPFPRTPKNLKF